MCSALFTLVRKSGVGGRDLEQLLRETTGRSHSTDSTMNERKDCRVWHKPIESGVNTGYGNQNPRIYDIAPDQVLTLGVGEWRSHGGNGECFWLRRIGRTGDSQTVLEAPQKTILTPGALLSRTRVRSRPRPPAGCRWSAERISSSRLTSRPW